MPASLDPQLAFDERAINDPDLESALERRLRAKQDVAEASGVVKKAHEDVLRELAKHPPIPEDAAYRVGRFRIAIRHVEGRHVEFDTDDSDQLSFTLLGEDGEPVKRARAPRRSKREDVPAGDESLEPAGPAIDDDGDLRPTGEVNADALRGEADRSVIAEPTPIRGRSQQQPPVH